MHVVKPNNVHRFLCKYEIGSEAYREAPFFRKPHFDSPQQLHEPQPGFRRFLRTM